MSRRRFRRLRAWVHIHEERIGFVLWIFMATTGLAAILFGHFIEDSEWRASIHPFYADPELVGQGARP
jgi:hypothetical protein